VASSTFGWAAAAALIVAGCSGAVPNPEIQQLLGKHDVVYERIDTFVVERDARKNLRLSSETELSLLFLSERAAESASQQIAEPYYAPVEGLRAYLDGDALSSSKITKLIPERRDVFLSDVQVHAIDYGGVQPGQRADIRYRQRYTELAYLPLLLVPDLDHVKRSTIVFRHPPSIRVDFELFFPRERLSPIIERTSTRTSIEFRDLRHREPLALFPYNGYAAVVWPQLSEAGQRLNPVRPEEFSRWYLQKLAGLPPPSADDRRMVQRLVASATTPREKTRAIYDYVRSNIRYIADERNLASIVPRPPSLVLERRYGDCKDKAFLVAQLAATVGLNVELVIVGTRPVAEVGGVHRYLFNHAIAALVEGDRRLFFDPTCRSCELGNLPEGDVEATAVVVNSSAPRKVIVPAPEQRPSLELEIEAGVDALASGTARLVLRNDLFYAVSELRRTAPPEKLQRSLSERLGEYLSGVLLRQFRFETIREDHAVLHATADLSHFVVRSPTRLYLPQTPFRVVDKEMLDRGKDPHILFRPRRAHLKLRVRLHASGYSITTAPEVRWGAAEVAEFTARLAAERSQPEPDVTSSVIVADYSYRERVKRLLGPSRASYLALCRRYLEAGRAMYVLTRGAK
jgi:hypothetical protein